jgi:hypothetical protein
MNIEKIEKQSLFIHYCKENYYKGIFPGNTKQRNCFEYERLIQIIKVYIENNLVEKFSEYLQEGQYLIQLWAAHLILEYFKPDESLKLKCIAQIVKYSENPLEEEVALQEKVWLLNYYK